MRRLAFLAFFSSLGLWSFVVSALPFCLQSSGGMKCWFQTEAACEEARDEHEWCVVNPLKSEDQDEDNRYLKLQKFSDNLCVGSVCIKYNQEVCNEEERRVDRPLKCETDPTP